MAPEGAVDDDSIIIFNLGCHQMLTSILMKNLHNGDGTGEYSVYIGKSIDGPWEFVISGVLNQSSSCSDKIESIKIKRR